MHLKEHEEVITIRSQSTMTTPPGKEDDERANHNRLIAMALGRLLAQLRQRPVDASGQQQPTTGGQNLPRSATQSTSTIGFDPNDTASLEAMLLRALQEHGDAPYVPRSAPSLGFLADDGGTPRQRLLRVLNEALELLDVDHLPDGANLQASAPTSSLAANIAPTSDHRPTTMPSSIEATNSDRSDGGEQVHAHAIAMATGMDVAEGQIDDGRLQMNLIEGNASALLAHLSDTLQNDASVMIAPRHGSVEETTAGFATLADDGDNLHLTDVDCLPRTEEEDVHDEEEKEE